MSRRFWRGADIIEAQAFFFHCLVFVEPTPYAFKKRFHHLVGRFRHAVMHPLAFPPRFDDSGPAKIREMTRYLWLIRAQDFYEKADANLAIPNEIQ